MRILQVIHQFPPHSSQGSEVYCRDLSLALADIGNEVGIFHTSNTKPRFPRRLLRGSDERLTVFHCIDGAEYARAADWPNHFLRKRFAEVLVDFRPDIVHFHNYISLGDDLVGMASAFGAGVIYTLHDYGLICPNNLLMQGPGNLCGKMDAGFFQDCCPAQIRSSGGKHPWIRHLLPSLSRWQAFTNQQKHPAIRLAMQSAISTTSMMRRHLRGHHSDNKRSFYMAATQRIFNGVDLFISPSTFLQDRYISCGLPANRIRCIRNGIKHFSPMPKILAEHVRFGYIGAIHAHKGVDLLVRAFNGLGDQASLHIYGTSFNSPVSEAYAERLRGIAGANTHFHGEYQNSRIAEVLANIDVIVVPSLWYENSPLTIQEAFLAGVPVITADVGGMAELISDQVDGLHFKFGDEESLRSALKQLVDKPELIMSLTRNIPQVPKINEQVKAINTCYSEILSDMKMIDKETR